MLLSELELTFFLRQLHYLLKNGISLYPALEILFLDVGSRSIRKPIREIMRSLREGQEFSVAIHEILGVEIFITNIIKVGEANGNLFEALEKASNFLERRVELKNRIIGVFAYPAVLLCLGLTILVWVNIKILPQFQEIFAYANIPLPLPTRIVFGVHNFFMKYWWNFLLVAGITGAGLYYAFKHQLRMFLSKVYFTIPLIGTFAYYLALMNFLSNVSSLHNSGISLIRSLQLTNQTVNNKYLKKTLDQALARIVEGEKFSKALWDTGFFPAMIIKMIAVGEETADLDKILIKVTDYLNDELDMELKRFIAIIAPVSLAVIGAFVVLIGVSFLLPLFQMTGVVRVR